MKRLLQSLFLFGLPLFLIGIVVEFGVRGIPNDYELKSSYLEKHSDSIQVLILGSSHAFAGINPSYISMKSFNASYVSQSIDFDYEILKKFEANWHRLKVIVMPVSYFTLFSNLETGKEKWRIKNYNIYYGMNVSRKIEYNSELFGSSLVSNLEKMFAFYKDRKSFITGSNLGWGELYNSKNKKDLFNSAIVAANRHNSNNYENWNRNQQILQSIILFAKEKGIKILFYTPPAYYTYYERLDEDKLDVTLKHMYKVQEIFDHVRYINFLKDSSYTQNEFFDADHLNEIGARKFTIILDHLINDFAKR